MANRIPETIMRALVSIEVGAEDLAAAVKFNKLEGVEAYVVAKQIASVCGLLLRTLAKLGG